MEEFLNLFTFGQRKQAHGKSWILISHCRRMTTKGKEGSFYTAVEDDADLFKSGPPVVRLIFVPDPPEKRLPKKEGS